MIEDLKSKILEAVERYLKSHEKAPQKRLDLISKVELKEELGIGDKTLKGNGCRDYRSIYRLLKILEKRIIKSQTF